MTISNLPQRPEEDINIQLHQESIVPKEKFDAQLLPGENYQSFAQLAIDIDTQQGYDFVTEGMEGLVTTVDEAEDWFWVDMTDEPKREDEEERSELAEIEEDRIFYTSKMGI